MRRQTPSDDEGSILVLTLGLVAVLVVVVAIVVDVSAVILAKRAVSSAADEAAVSAAQALDTDAFYAGGLPGGRVPLSPSGAAERVAVYAADAAQDQPGLQLSVQVQGSTAVVTGTRTVTPPFSVFGQGPVTVTAVARANAPVVPP